MKKRLPLLVFLVFVIIFLIACGSSSEPRPSQTTQQEPNETAPPLVNTLNATNVTTNSAQLNCNLSSLGTAKSADISFQWGTTSGEYLYETSVGSTNTTGIFNTNVNVYAYMTYYYRAKVVGQGEVYGAELAFTTPPPIVIDQNKSYRAAIKTNLGDFTIQLFSKDAPIAVNNFVRLAREGFYDGVKFHRIVEGFVIQGGDPTGTGTGGPGYKFIDEKIIRDYVPGTLAMANAGPNTNGSQFFITLEDLTGKLAKNYTIFGIVTDGFNVVQNIGDVQVTASRTGELSVPKDEILIKEIIIEEK